VTIPKRVRETIGLRVGDLVEASTRGGVIVLKPKVLVDREHARAVRPAARPTGRRRPRVVSG
jgi:AbrB family looped-hinge helix DNA binding protein